VEDKHNIDEVIKSSFENTNFKAPESLWANISANISNNPHTELDDRIRESFEKQKDAVPNSVWENVNHQLNIDRVWKGIDSGLNKIAYRKVIRKVASLAALLLLFAYLGYKNFSEENPQITFTEFNIDNDKVINKTVKGEKVTFESHNIGANELSKGSSDVFEDVNGESNDNSRDIIQVLKIEKLNFENNNSSNQVGSSVKNVQKLITLNSLEDSGFEHLALKGIEVFNASISDNTDNLPKQKVEFLNNIIVPSIKPVAEFYQKIEKAPLINKTFVGITYALNNTWIINNRTKESFDKNSLSSSTLSYTNNYGLIVDYPLVRKFTVSGQFFINSVESQKYNFYEDGKYHTQKIDLKYYKTAILINREIPLYSQKFDYSFVVGCGAYFAYVSNFSSQKDGLPTDVKSDYDEINYGTKVAIGPQIKTETIKISVGVNSDYGVNNIYKGSSEYPPSLNKTNSSNIGVFVNVMYRL